MFHVKHFQILRSSKIIIEKNKNINLISKKTEKISKERHIIDSAQIIDLIDLNRSICTDLGQALVCQE